MWAEKNTKAFSQNPFLYCFDFLTHEYYRSKILYKDEWFREWGERENCSLVQQTGHRRVTSWPRE